jgi:hypothetical protein
MHPQGYAWNLMRGNALLAFCGQKQGVNTTAGYLELYTTSDLDRPVILQFRGGKEKPWWREDMELLGSIGVYYLEPKPTGVLVLQELDNSLNELYYPAPADERCRELVSEALDRWRNNKRIHKNTQRARAYCYSCPVRAKCDSLDIENGEQQDWPPEWVAGSTLRTPYEKD